MKRTLTLFLSFLLILSLYPVSVSADEPGLPEGLYWRPVVWNDEGKVEADLTKDITNDTIEGSPGYSEARQFIYVNDGTQTPLSDEDLTFSGEYFNHMDGNPYFVKEGEKLVDIVFTAIGSGGSVSYKGFSIPIESILPEFGFYSSKTPSAETILSEWNYDGTNDTIYFIARDGATISKVYKDDDTDWMDLMIGEIEGGTCVALSTSDVQSIGGAFNLHYDGKRTDGETFTDQQIFFFVNDARPFAFHWVNLDDDVFEVQDGLDREMWQAPGQECLVQFVNVSKDGTETPLKFMDLTFPDNVSAEIAAHWDGETEDPSYLQLNFDRPFGDYEITDKAHGLTMPLHVDLPSWGYYSIEKPSTTDDHSDEWNDQLRDALQTEWKYDGKASTLYLRAAYNASVGTTITEIEQESNHDVSWTIAKDGRSAAVVLKDLDPNQPWLNLKLQIRRDIGEEIFNEEQWANIRVTDTRPRLVVEQWFLNDEDEWEWADTYDEPSLGMWANRPRQFKFFTSDDRETPITKGVTLSSGAPATLSYSAADCVWTLTFMDYGAFTISYQKDGKEYAIGATSDPPDGFFGSAERSFGSFLGFGAETISYVEGFGRKVYFSDLKYYDDGFESVEILSGNAAATEIDDTLWCIELPPAARGNVDVQIKAVYKTDDPNNTDEITLHFEGTPAKDDRTMRDKADKTVDLAVGTAGKETLIAIDGAVSASEPILVASYGEHGRFMGLTLVKESGDQTTVSADAEAIKVFWIDASFAPKCSAEEIGEE